VKVVSPVGQLGQERAELTPRRRSLDGATLGVIQLRGSAPEFIDRIIERLSTDFELAELIRHVKDVDTAPSPPDVLAMMAGRADVVVSSYGH
jgi:hypothetical protein